ncbi:MAG: GH3 auxin-responsive promoter family protein [Acidobacteriota bacterium]
MRARCLIANGLWLASSLPRAEAFANGLRQVREVQEAILLRTLRRNAATPFGVAHGFASIRSVHDYRERVPIRTYDESELDSGIAEPVDRYEPTSGSSGAAKHIPYTRTLRRQFDAAIAPWIVSLFRQHPAAFAGEAYWSVSPGAESDEEALGPLQRRLVRAVQAVPSSVRLTSDLAAFRRQTLAHLQRCRTLSLISVWHPSFLDLLVPEELDTVATWPHLRVISCWADAHAAGAAAALAKRFPQAVIQPKGLLSTEGVVTIPYDGARTFAYRSHFCEFRDGAQTVTASELEPGRRYDVILTTGGGLYRYAIEDVVEVTGFREACPLLRFVGRAGHVSDHFGEKLNEIFVRERLERALQDVPHHFAMLACEGNAYVLFIESASSDDALRRATALLEHSLREAFHYDHCRRLGQLGPLGTFRVHRGAATYLTVRSATRLLGSIKIPALDSEMGWRARFNGACVAP